jgi:pilus assembly protein CpaB
MKPTRIVLLVIAVLAAGLAAYLATRGGAVPKSVQQVVEIESPKTQVLVAAQQIGVGERLTPKVMQWQEWPESAVRPEYVTVSQSPDAPQQLTGTVARFEIFPGEPVLESKLVHAEQGYLSAVLEKGMRAVSLPVSAESSAGGFIVPNDRVDIVQTLDSDAGPQTQTVIENVKVLAIGTRLGERGPTAGTEKEQTPQSQVFTSGTIATVELDPKQAEVIVTAISKGHLSLVLRSISDFGAPTKLGDVSEDGRTVKVVRFGVASSVLPSSTGAVALPVASPVQMDGSGQTDVPQQVDVPAENSAEPVAVQ